MGLPLENSSYYDNSGGVDLKSSPTKIAEDTASQSLNVDYSTDGAVFTRNGSKIQNLSGGIPAQMAGAPRTLLLFDYRRSDGTAYQLIAAGTTIKKTMSSPVDMVTGLNATLPIPDIEFQVTPDDEYAIWGNGLDTNLKFNGTLWTNLSLPRATAPTLTDFAVGTLPAGDYYYYVSFARTVLGVIVEEGELSPISSVLTIAANRTIRVTIPTCSETLLAGVTAQCNARVIYRVSPTSSGVAYQIAIVADNVTTTYNDNTAADGVIEADFDNQAAPTSAVFEEYMGYMIYRDDAQKTDYLVSKHDLPWNVPEITRTILDGPIQCIRRIYGAVILGTDKSLWVINGDPTTTDPRRISSTIGILNNRCAVGEDALYIFATNRKFYTVSPTDFSQDQMRLDEPLSVLIEPLFNQISASGLDGICMEYYNTANQAKVMISCPIGASTNTKLIIWNETQSSTKNKPVWQIWDNLFCSALKQFVVSGIPALYSGDYNGFLWKLDDSTLNGDGAEINGTATGGSTTTLDDSTQTWTVNAYVGMVVRCIAGTGADQYATVISNTATQLTFSAVAIAFDSTSQYTIGGYDAYHYTNWKFVIGSYDHLKQLWFIWVNANASGNYTIDLILQFDFDQTITNQTNLLLTLAASNAIWGAVIWLAFIWGARSVFHDRLRVFGRYRAIRIAFSNRKAGQPFQINGFSLSNQNKGLFFKGS